MTQLGFPFSLWQEVARHLDIKSLSNLALVSKMFKNIISEIFAFQIRMKDSDELKTRMIELDKLLNKQLGDLYNLFEECKKIGKEQANRVERYGPNMVFARINKKINTKLNLNLSTYNEDPLNAEKIKVSLICIAVMLAATASGILIGLHDWTTFIVLTSLAGLLLLIACTIHIRAMPMLASINENYSAEIATKSKIQFKDSIAPEQRQRLNAAEHIYKTRSLFFNAYIKQNDVIPEIDYPPLQFDFFAIMCNLHDSLKLANRLNDNMISMFDFHLEQYGKSKDILPDNVKEIVNQYFGVKDDSSDLEIKVEGKLSENTPLLSR